MGLVEKRRQLKALFGTYNKRIERLYDEYIDKLTRLANRVGIDVEDFLKKDGLFRFDKYPELREELNDIFSKYVQKDVLAYKAGITDGVALAYSHQNSVLTGFSVLSDKAISHARNIAAETFIRSRLRSKDGLNLSQLVWNYAQQAKSEFEVAVSNVIADGLKKGTSAEELGRLVREYLNNPDMMYRRYHRTILDANGNKKDIVRWRRRVIDENGKVRFVEQPLEKVGAGQYRSSRKNANRLMRTEINGSYHRANYERWQKEPFVIGIAIELSPQHPAEDMCDELSGESFDDPRGHYPKDFLFIGWHPQCLCMSNPITIQGEEKKEFYRRLAAGEDMTNYVSPNAVKDIPDNAKQWIDNNREQFIRAGERGKLGWVWRENTKYWQKQFTADELRQMGYEAVAPKKRVKTEAEKAAIQARWDERRLTNAAINDAKAMMQKMYDFPSLENETTSLVYYIKNRDRYGILSAMDAIRPKLAYERSITPDILLDSVMRKKYGNEAVDALYENTKRTINSKVTGDINSKIEKLRYEAKWVVENRSFATVKEVAAYYEREAVRLEAMRDFEKIRGEIIAIEKNLTKYGVETVLKGNEWYGDVAIMQTKLDGLQKYKTTLDRIDKIEKFAETSKSPIIRTLLDSIHYAVDRYGLNATLDTYFAEAEKTMERLEKEAARRAKKRLQKLMGETTSLDDLKKAMGSEFPKSLEHLQSKIDSYVKGQGLTDEQTQNVLTKLREVMANGDLGMNVPRTDSRGNEVFPKLFSSHFKSQIETGTGNGCVDVSYRKRATNQLFGAAIDKMKPIEFEKYGFLMDKDILAQSKSSIAGGYWNHGDGIQIRFKKDRVVATFTTCDSLGSGIVPSLTTDPKTSAIASVDRVLRNTANHLSAIESTKAYASSYIELQYHGNLTLDCIESIFIPKNVLPKISVSTLELMRKTGAILYSESEAGALITL